MRIAAGRNFIHDRRTIRLCAVAMCTIFPVKSKTTSHFCEFATTSPGFYCFRRKPRLPPGRAQTSGRERFHPSRKPVGISRRVRFHSSRPRNFDNCTAFNEGSAHTSHSTRQATGLPSPSHIQRTHFPDMAHIDAAEQGGQRPVCPNLLTRQRSDGTIKWSWRRRHAQSVASLGSPESRRLRVDSSSLLLRVETRHS